jgi:arsenical pump membrane protein
MGNPPSPEDFVMAASQSHQYEIQAARAAMAQAAIRPRCSPVPAIKKVSWSVILLIAGLSVMVEALARTGLITMLADVLHAASNASPNGAAAVARSSIAFASNVINNLAAGLIGRSTLAIAHASQHVTNASLIGVDLGPNLSVTGSLATLPWITAIRRESEDVGIWRFLRVGVVVMPPGLILALAT